MSRPPPPSGCAWASRRARLRAPPVLETAPAARRTGAALVTTGIGPGLMAAAKEATRHLIDGVVRRTGIEETDAHLLASIAGDLVISEIVDMPNWVVSVHLDRSPLPEL